MIEQPDLIRSNVRRFAVVAVEPYLSAFLAKAAPPSQQGRRNKDVMVPDRLCEHNIE